MIIFFLSKKTSLFAAILFLISKCVISLGQTRTIVNWEQTTPYNYSYIFDTSAQSYDINSGVMTLKYFEKIKHQVKLQKDTVLFRLMTIQDNIIYDFKQNSMIRAQYLVEIVYYRKFLDSIGGHVVVEFLTPSVIPRIMLDSVFDQLPMYSLGNAFYVTINTTTYRPTLNSPILLNYVIKDTVIKNCRHEFKKDFRIDKIGRKHFGYVNLSYAPSFAYRIVGINTSLFNDGAGLSQRTKNESKTYGQTGK